jgi:CarboxypepD_reg-like domain
MKKATVLVTVLVMLMSVVLMSCGGDTSRFDGTVRNGIINEPMPGVKVSFDGKINTLSDENGMFAFEGIKSGEHKIQIKIDGFESIEQMYIINEDTFEEFMMFPSAGNQHGENDDATSEDMGNNRPKDIPIPIPPGEKLETIPGFEFMTELDNCKIIIGIAPSSVTTDDKMVAYVYGNIVKVTSNAPSGGLGMIDIISGNSIYSFEPGEGIWYKHVIPEETIPTPADVTLDYMVVLNGVMSSEDAIVTKLDPITIDGVLHERFHVSGIGKEASQSFNGEIFVLNNLIMGCDARIATGEYGSEQLPVYLVVYDIGKVEAIEIPTDVKVIETEFPGEHELPPIPEPEPIERPDLKIENEDN